MDAWICVRESTKREKEREREKEKEREVRDHDFNDLSFVQKPFVASETFYN